MDYQKIGSGYLVLVKSGDKVQAYLTNGVIIEQRNNSFKEVYKIAKRELKSDMREDV